MPAVVTSLGTCPMCGEALASDSQPCPLCHAPVAWVALQRAEDYAIGQFREWSARAIIAPENLQRIESRYTETRAGNMAAAGRGEAVRGDRGLPPVGQCWNCGTASPPSSMHCWNCGVPIDGTWRDALRHLAFLDVEIARFEHEGVIWMAESHGCHADVVGRIAAMRARGMNDRLSAVALAAARMAHLRTVKDSGKPMPPPLPPTPPPTPPPMPGATAGNGPHVSPPLPVEFTAVRPMRRPVLEILLDPRSIQWLLASGGVLLVFGIVIWLASLGVFKNPRIVAAAIGVGTIALLMAGWSTIRFTRYQLAGRAITLLACLVMPLNLWFFNSHQVVTLDQHLWLAGLVCCALYAASAWVLEDALFVYVLTGGVAMTGLLMLADMHHFQEIAAPSTLLVVLGLIALHVERAFPEGEGAFSRQKFGMAFFWSAQAMLGSGLLMLLGAQITGWLFEPFFHNWLSISPLIVTDTHLKWWALALVAAGTYGYIYSDLVVRRVGVYVYIAAFTMLWGEVLVIDTLNLTIHPPMLILVLSLTGLVANVLQSRFVGKSKLARPVLPLALCLSLLPVLFGVVMHFRATVVSLHESWPFDVTMMYLIAMLVSAACCRVGAYLYREMMPRVSAAYLFGSAAATLVGAAALLTLAGIKTWDQQAPLLMLIPIGYLLASRLNSGRPSADPLAWVAQTATAVMLISVLGSSMHLAQRVFEPVVGQNLNLLLALFFAEAAVFHLLAVTFRKQGANVYLFTAMACGSIWQLLNYANVSTEVYTVAFAALGMGLLIGYRLSALEKLKHPMLAQASFQCANMLMSLSFVASVLITLSRFAGGGAGHSAAWLLAALAAASLAAAFLVRHAGWKRWYVTVAIVQSGLAAVLLERLLNMSAWQNVEIFCVGIGIALLITGHIGWAREQNAQGGMVSHNLLLGSIMAGLPLAIAAVASRFGSEISLPDEIGLLTVGIGLFVSGFLFQIRATTLTGGALLALQMVMMLVSLGMKAQLAVGVYLAAGGAVIFGTGLLLSLYRDRLIALPQQIKQREGIFKVLGWR